jgi:hypothetical protein
MRVTLFAEHARVTFQAHAVRIFGAVAPDNISAPGALYLESQFFPACFVAHCPYLSYKTFARKKTKGEFQ